MDKLGLPPSPIEIDSIVKKSPTQSLENIKESEFMISTTDAQMFYVMDLIRIEELMTC